MRVLFNLLLDICLLRQGPQSLPASWPLFKLGLLAYALSGAGIWLSSVTVSGALLLIAVDLGLLTGLTYIALSLAGHSARFVQTAIALLGTGTLLQIIALPVTVWMHQEVADHQVTGLPWLLWLALLGWSVAIMAHILHHALSASRSVALLYTLGYLMISWTVSGWLYPLE